MQTPAAFEYERATSLEGAIASLQRLGPEARVIAGGHSLLPMMKLRLANPEHLIDINDLTELAFIRQEGSEIRIGALTRHVDLLKSELLAEHYPALPRRRARDRRPGRAQPRHDRRLALPGRSRRGPVGRVLRSQGQGRDPRRRGRARRGHGGLPRRPVHDGGRRARSSPRSRLGVRPGAGSAHEKVERRAGDWAIAAASAAVWLHGGTIADAGIALSAVGLTTIHLTRAEELLRGKAPSDELFAAGGRDRLGGLLARRRRSRADRLQAPPRRRPHPTRTAPRDRARTARGGLTHATSR